MSTLIDIEKAIDALELEYVPTEECAAALLDFGDIVLGHWNEAHGEVPTNEQREGFRLLALHRQGAKKDASFNACRETCRELVYHYNLLMGEPKNEDVVQRKTMMYFVVKHLLLFVGGKLENEQLGDFCCSSRGLRQNMD